MQVLYHQRSKVKRRVTSVSSAFGNNDDSSHDNPLTPPRWLIEDKIHFALQPSQETIKILKDKKAQQKQLQSKNGDANY